MNLCIFLFHILSLPPHTLPKSHRNICTFLKFAFFSKATLCSDSTHSMELECRFSGQSHPVMQLFLFQGWGGQKSSLVSTGRLRMCLTHTEAPSGLAQPGAFEARPGFVIWDYFFNLSEPKFSHLQRRTSNKLYQSFKMIKLIIYMKVIY